MKNGYDTIDALCKQHRTTVYFDDGEGLIGVYNHRGMIAWYRMTEGGYSLSGTTETPQGAQERKLKRPES